MGERGEPMSARRFAAYAVLAAAGAALLLFVGGHLGAAGLALVAVAEAVVVGLIIRESSRPRPGLALTLPNGGGDEPRPEPADDAGPVDPTP